VKIENTYISIGIIFCSLCGQEISASLGLIFKAFDSFNVFHKIGK
jgi:hypothetical protein